MRVASPLEKDKRKILDVKKMTPWKDTATVLDEEHSNHKAHEELAGIEPYRNRIVTWYVHLVAFSPSRESNWTKPYMTAILADKAN